MDYSKSSTTNLAILSLFLTTTVLLLCSWQPLNYKTLLFPPKNAPNITSHSVFRVIQREDDELETALQRASMANRTLIITIINKAYVEPHENEYPAMFDLFLEGFWAGGDETRWLVGHLLVVTMDRAAHERCVFRRLNCYRLASDGSGGGERFAGEKIFMSKEFIEMMWRRTRFVLDVLRRGYNFIFTDTYILWLRNPFPRLSQDETLDVQMSTDYFKGEPTSPQNIINTGFYFIRSNERTVSLFETWYEARKNSTGLKEQDVLINLIRNEGVLEKLGLNAWFFDTLYFSGFCHDSPDVGLVVTVHANCCRSIRAKVVDLKVVLSDWERFKNWGNNDTRRFEWSTHRFCKNSWRV